MARTAEQGHTKKCMARALICAIENLRDDENLSDIGFALEVQDGTNLRSIALDYSDILTLTGGSHRESLRSVYRRRGRV